jgi:hypothetical protein
MKTRELGKNGLRVSGLGGLHEDVGLLDTNVILDIALRRPGLFEGSKRALENADRPSGQGSALRRLAGRALP